MKTGPYLTTIHAVVTRGVEVGKIWYTASCIEIAVVTQGRTLDEVAANLGQAIRLHLRGDARALGVVDAPRISVIYEMTVPTS